MQPRRWLFVLLVISLALSCDDESALMPFPSKYMKTDADAGRFRLFTTAGEITNQSIVGHYILKDTPVFNPEISYMANYQGFLDTLEFISQDEVVLSSSYRSIDCRFDGVGNFLLMTEKELTTHCCTYPEAISHSLTYYISKFKPEIISEHLYSSTGGNYYFSYYGADNYVLHKTLSGQVTAPLIQYSLHQKDRYPLYFHINNVLDPEFYRNIPEGDTVSLMEGRIFLRKF
jgi:hypothetical protein